MEVVVTECHSCHETAGFLAVEPVVVASTVPHRTADSVDHTQVVILSHFK